MGLLLAQAGFRFREAENCTVGLHPREGPKIWHGVKTNICRGGDIWQILLAETSCVSVCTVVLPLSGTYTGGSRACGSRGGGCVVTRGGLLEARRG